MDITNKKPVSEIQEDKKQEVENVTADIWEAIATMGADLAEAQSKIAELENTLKGGVK